MGGFFNKDTEYTFAEGGVVEHEEVENESVETPDEPIEPEVVDDPVKAEEPATSEDTKVDRRGRHAGGQDYVYYGSF